MSDAAPVRGVCTLPEMLEAFLRILPAGVALSCMETALASGLIVRDGEVFPWDVSPTPPEAAEAHFRPWVARLGVNERTAVQRMCGPFSSPFGSPTIVYILCCYSDTVASNALSRGWLDADELAYARSPDFKAYVEHTYASFVAAPPRGFRGDPIAWSRGALTVHDTDGDTPPSE
jgi:hypothetical protein